MSEKIYRTLKQSIRNAEEYTPLILERLREAGVEINPGLVYAAAVNFPALDKLSRE